MRPLIIGLILVAALGSTAFAQVKFFHGTWEQAMAESKKTGKPLFVDFWATWCGPCKMMNNTTFQNAEVGQVLNASFIPIKIDVDRGEGATLAQKYNIRAMPTLMVIDGAGKSVATQVGFMNDKQLLSFVEPHADKKKVTP